MNYWLIFLCERNKTLTTLLILSSPVCCSSYPSVHGVCNVQSFDCLPADTVVFTHAQPITSDMAYSMLPDVNQELLEKPSSKEDNLRMLLDLNGGVCEVVTGLVVGAIFYLFYTGKAGLIILNIWTMFLFFFSSVPYSCGPGIRRQVRLFLSAPSGFNNWTSFLFIRSIDERTLVYFADNPRHILEAYIESGEGIDRAGGFAIQVRFHLLPYFFFFFQLAFPLTTLVSFFDYQGTWWNFDTKDWGRL